MEQNERLRLRLNHLMKEYRKVLSMERENTELRLQSCIKKQKDLKKSLIVYIAVPMFLLILNRILKGLSDTTLTSVIFRPAAYAVGFVFLVTLPFFIVFSIRMVAKIIKHRKQLPFEKPAERTSTKEDAMVTEKNYLIAEQKNRFILLRYEEYERKLLELQDKIDEEPPGITESELNLELDRMIFYEKVFAPSKP